MTAPAAENQRTPASSRDATAAAHRLLLTCARGGFDGKSRYQTLDLIRSGLDWDAALTSGRRHRLLPLLFVRLRDLESGLVPQQVVTVLREAYRESWVRNQVLQDELARIIETLRGHQITPIVLKGAALARTVYGDMALRPMYDIDLLVRPEQMDLVRELLPLAGFGLSPKVKRDLVEFQSRIGGGLEWVCSRAGLEVHLDVHHHLVGVDWCRHMLSADVENLWSEARPLSVGGAEALRLSNRDMLVHLCIHPAMQHGYSHPVSGIVDIDWLIGGSVPELVWATVVERARQFRAKTVVYLGLLTAHNLFGTDVPSNVLEALRPPAYRLRALGRAGCLDASSALGGPIKELSGLEQLRTYATVADRPRDVARMARSVLLPDREWLRVRYSLQSKRDVRRARLTHPLRVVRAAVRAARRPLVESGLG